MSEALQQDTTHVTDMQPTGMPPESFQDYLRTWLRRVRAGDLGSLPIILGLIAIVIIFGSLQPIFYVERNFVNLLLQMAGITATAIGIVFVLLIAEIDLSVAYVGAVGAVIMTLLLRESGPAWPWPLAIGTGLLATTIIGMLQGLIITKAGVPSFVVTLAGYLAWSGVVLIMTTELSTAGVIVIQNEVVLGIANSFLPQLGGWAIFALVIGGYALGQITQRQSLLRQNLPAKPWSVVALQIGGLALVTGAAVWYANRDRGVPVVTLIILILLAIWSFVANRTRFGRYVYAVGGNPEAARRAGINVDRVRIVVFMISGFMAGVGGIILASRLRSVDTNSGGGDLLLNVIAAAVIGGTSLFGGHGRVMNALIGALVIAAVANGMGLMGWASGIKFIVTGLVLLAAVLIDSFSRRSREASGIA
jgi:D-xylose transport system permease protein